MNEEVAQQAGGVPRYARSSTRRAPRNGYRPRSLKNRFGELSLQKRQLREIPFETTVFARYSRAGKIFLKNILVEYPVHDSVQIPDSTHPRSPGSISRRRILPLGVPPCQTASTSQIGLFLPKGARFGRFIRPRKFRCTENPGNSEKTVQ